MMPSCALERCVEVCLSAEMTIPRPRSPRSCRTSRSDLSRFTRANSEGDEETRAHGEEQADAEHDQLIHACCLRRKWGGYWEGRTLSDQLYRIRGWESPKSLATRLAASGTYRRGRSLHRARKLPSRPPHLMLESFTSRIEGHRAVIRTLLPLCSGENSPRDPPARACGSRAQRRGAAPRREFGHPDAHRPWQLRSPSRVVCLGPHRTAPDARDRARAQAAP